MTHEKLYKTSEVAEIMGVKRKTIYRWLASGFLPANSYIKFHNGYIYFKRQFIKNLKKGKMNEDYSKK